MSKRLAKYFHCPTEFTLAVLDGKWKTVILSYLMYIHLLCRQVVCANPPKI